jgi:hypothetical protein
MQNVYHLVCLEHMHGDGKAVRREKGNWACEEPVSSWLQMALGYRIITKGLCEGGGQWESVPLELDYWFCLIFINQAFYVCPTHFVLSPLSFTRTI